MGVHEGGCHCGAVRFRVTIQHYAGDECNCSICTKKGFLHLIVPAGDFELLQGESELSTYRFNTGVAKHRFCRVCGVHPFYTPRSHPDRIDVNIRCLDDVPLERFAIEPFDGRHWEDAIVRLRAEEVGRAASNPAMDETSGDGTRIGTPPRRNQG